MLRLIDQYLVVVFPPLTKCFVWRVWDRKGRRNSLEIQMFALFFLPLLSYSPLLFLIPDSQAWLSFLKHQTLVTSNSSLVGWGIEYFIFLCQDHQFKPNLHHKKKIRMLFLQQKEASLGTLLKMRIISTDPFPFNHLKSLQLREHTFSLFAWFLIIVCFDLILCLSLNRKEHWRYCSRHRGKCCAGRHSKE